ncbi:Lipopolysaccharide-modifying protein [Cynara cardunculus var. scolymus]|uniref:Lipopolysaccharide-modifying protein n=1 Tax=Cynara cardunculus var. scolymus TaxID=59895 RepID=A0A103XC22_CYNCS|nr:Lipopolysaccharide-modifying protein [Cynara cardunculus var. scolymus]
MMPNRHKPETNQKPWEVALKDIKEGNKRVKWKERVPYAYWKGNRNVAPVRADLLKCNHTPHVDWATRLFSQAQENGDASSRFIQEFVKMENAYDYMLHLLTEYAKLLKFKPTIHPNAVELCSESMACLADGKWRKFMADSLVEYPTDTTPCNMPPPYDPSALKAIIDNRRRTIKQVEMREDKFWKNKNLK